MSTVHIPREQLRGSREVNYYDFTPTMSLSDNVNPKRNFAPTQNNINAPKLLNSAIHRPHTMKVLGCKSENIHQVIRRAPIPETHGMYPHTGYARGQEKGLAFLPNQPISGPIMKQASSFFAGADNRLGAV
jgi:hypothetical protein